MISLFNVNYFYRVLQPRIEIPQLPTIIIHLLWGVMGVEHVASAVFKTVEGSYAALVGSIPSLSAKEL